MALEECLVVSKLCCHRESGLGDVFYGLGKKENGCWRVLPVGAPRAEV